MELSYPSLLHRLRLVWKDVQRCMAFGIRMYSSYSRFLLFSYYRMYWLPDPVRPRRHYFGQWMFEVAQEDGTPLLWGWLQSKTCEGHGHALCLKICEMKVHVCSPRVLSQALSFTSQSPKCFKNSRWNSLIWMFSRQMRWWNWMEGSTRHFKVEEESNTCDIVGGTKKDHERI